ncbi:MAG: tetratricopeptide repeat protein [Azonexus sp.]
MRHKRLSAEDLLTAAMAALASGNLTSAGELAEKLNAASPTQPDGHHLLGLIARRQNRIDEACRHYGRALQLADNPAARSVVLGNWGNALLANERSSEAEARFRAALADNPANRQAAIGLGDALRRLARAVESEKVLREVLATEPDNAVAWVNLAATLQALGRPGDAAEANRSAIRLDPNSAVAHYNLGCLLMDAGQNGEAIAQLSQSLRLDPDYADAAATLLRLAQSTCAWDVAEPLEAQARQRVRDGGTVFPFAFLAIPASREEQQHCARQWAKRRYGSVSPLWQHQPGQRQAALRRRIGYLSSDFHDHATAYLMAEIFELHDHRQFELFAYSSGPDDRGAMRGRLLKAFDHFTDIAPISDEAAARRIQADGIDILVDLKGYTRDSRTGILAYRPAPVQAQYLGYPGTLGADFVDYVLTDEIVTPPEHLEAYDEAAAYLPGSYQCNDRQRPLGQSPGRAACGLPDQAFVFCCFNHSYKIRREVFAVWCRLLTSVPDSVLWLLRSNPEGEAALRAAAAAFGIAGERLIFAPVVPLPAHIARIGEADVFLDTQPYNAHTTASDALWAGVPVVAWRGDAFPSRVSSSLLTAVGLPELIADDAEQYFSLAKRLADEPAWRAELGQRLVAARQQGRLFDSQGFTDDLEGLYRAMWARFAAGEAPATIHPIPENKENLPVSDYRELLIGAGSSRVKKLAVNDRREWHNLTTLDINPDHLPDLVWDLTQLPLPFADNQFDEIHAYEVLEHTGQQGDYKFFFAQFSELWRILKPGGMLIATCPSRNSPWAWGDPSHTRVIQPENFIFLDQAQYVAQVGITAMSDFRYIYQADFSTAYSNDDGTTFSFALKAVKPSRYQPPRKPDAKQS